MSDTRGQAFTLEGVIGAMILLTAVLFALNSAVLLPSTGETGNQAQIEQEAKDVMEVAATDGHLSEIARCYDTDEEDGGWFGDESVATAPPEETDLHTLLEETFDDRDRSYNVEVKYDTAVSAERLVYNGASTRDGVTVSRTVTLYEDDPLLVEDEDGNPCADEDGDVTDDEYPIPRATEDDDYIYSVVEVRLTIR